MCTHAHFSVHVGTWERRLRIKEQGWKQELENRKEKLGIRGQRTKGQSNVMAVKSILWPFKFRTKVPCMRRWRWTPLTASKVFTIVQDGFFALRTISIYFVLKKFNNISATRAFNIENCIKTPFLCIISSAFSHFIISYSLVILPSLRSSHSIFYMPVLVPSALGNAWYRGSSTPHFRLQR